jgi:hypothetical protein
MFDKEYCKFHDDLLKSNLPACLIKGVRYQFIVLSRSTEYHQKEPDIFWHVSSIKFDEGCDEKAEIHPCVNTFFESSCVRSSASQNLLDSLYPRTPCSFRSAYSKNIRFLINDLNSNELIGMKVWIADGPHNGGPTKRFYIRKTYEQIDYVAIFEVLKERTDKNGLKFTPLILITGYPIELNSFRKRYDREWKNGCLI